MVASVCSSCGGMLHLLEHLGDWLLGGKAIGPTQGDQKRAMMHITHTPHKKKPCRIENRP